MYESNFDGMEITQTRNLFEKAASGKSWKKKPIETHMEIISARQYINAVENKWRGDRYEYGYTYAGYIPVRVTSVSPDHMKKCVWEYSLRLTY